MSDRVVILLPGAGGSNRSIDRFVRVRTRGFAIEIVPYPDWAWQLRHPGLETLCRPVIDHIVELADGRPVILAGYSLGGPIAALVLDAVRQREVRVEAVVAIDPVMPVSTGIDPGVVGRLASRRGAGGTRALWRPGVWWGLANRAVARILMRQMPGPAGLVPRIAKGLAPPGSRLNRELCIRMMIRSAVAYGQVAPPPAPDMPCWLIHTRSSKTDFVAWRRAFPLLQSVEFAGDHRSLFDDELETFLARLSVGSAD
jgi:pimeloyl-ACP methyl ester carboxylesterase